MDFAEWLPRLQELGLTWGLIVLKAVAIFFFGRIAAKVISNLIDRIMKRASPSVSRCRGRYRISRPAC